MRIFSCQSWPGSSKNCAQLLRIAPKLSHKLAARAPRAAAVVAHPVLGQTALRAAHPVWAAHPHAWAGTAAPPEAHAARVAVRALEWSASHTSTWRWCN